MGTISQIVITNPTYKTERTARVPRNYVRAPRDWAHAPGDQACSPGRMFGALVSANYSNFFNAQVTCDMNYTLHQLSVCSQILYSKISKENLSLLSYTIFVFGRNYLVSVFIVNVNVVVNVVCLLVRNSTTELYISRSTATKTLYQVSNFHHSISSNMTTSAWK